MASKQVRPLTVLPQIGLILCLAGPAAAQPMTHYTADDAFYAAVFGMTDLDQSRDASSWPTEWNNGSNFCGPTAAANMLNFLAREGYDGLPFGSVDLEPAVVESLPVEQQSLASWQNGFRQRIGDELIGQLAVAMETDPDGGTGHNGVLNGLTSLLPAGFDAWIVGQRDCDGRQYDPVTPRVVFDEFDAGNYLLARVGYYESVGSGTRMRRIGGHWVTLTGVLRAGDLRRLYYTDPARDHLVGENDRATQSAFVVDATTLERVSVQTAQCSRTRWQLVDRERSDGAITVLEQVIVVAPPDAAWRDE